MYILLWCIKPSLDLPRREQENFYKLLLDWDKNIIKEYDSLIDNWINIKLFFKDLIYFIKEDWIKKIESNDNISKIIFILETLDELFIKAKNSLDENTTFLIWILKIVNVFNNWWNNLQNPIINEKIIEKSEKNKSRGEPCVHFDEKKISEKNNKNIVSNEDINNIFWDTSPQEKKVEKNNSSFDINLYINELKKLWAKWWLTMWIRGALINLVWNNLEIKFKTKFALNTINTNENLSILKQAFENIWFKDWNIILL